jgi:hypothetical protein
MSRNDNPQNFLSSSQLARRLGLKDQTLRKWRWEGRGPIYCRLGDNIKARVIYRSEDVESWLKQREFHNTAEETVRVGARVREEAAAAASGQPACGSQAGSGGHVVALHQGELQLPRA